MVRSFVLLLWTAAKVSAQMSCDAYAGQIVRPQTFDAATASLALVPKRGEFETSEAFRRRSSVSRRDPTAPLIISKRPEDNKYFVYDADTQKLRISPYAFDNANFDLWSAMYAAGMHDSLGVSISSNRDIVVYEADRAVGSYIATNGFGAKFRVTRIARRTAAIFEQKEDIGDYRTFLTEGDYIGELDISPLDAQRLKPLLRVAFVVLPKAPYLVSGQHATGDITPSEPVAVVETFSILIADIRCGLLLGPDGTVLGSYPTR